MRLETLHRCLQDIQNSKDDAQKYSSAVAAWIECDVFFTIHQQLAKIKAQRESAQKDEEKKSSQQGRGGPEPRPDPTLHSLLETVKRENKPILQYFIKSAHVANLKLQGTQSDKTTLKENWLKLSHYQALAEQGFLEPGHEKCSWIRGAFDVEALASQMEENALAELRAAIEYVRWCFLGVG